MYSCGIKQNYIMTFLLFGVLFFMYGNKILDTVVRYGRNFYVFSIVLIVCILLCVFMVYMLDKDCYGVRSWFQAGIAVSIITLVMPWFNANSNVHFITYISIISF